VQVSTLEAKNRLSALLAEVRRGQEVTITRHGVPVAKLVPVKPHFDREKARRAADMIRELGERNTLGGVTIKELVEEGRD
jgi:prevent-host-death family protein